MTKEEKILTLHPQGKRGVNIKKEKYDQIREYILSVLNERKDITFNLLSDKAVEELSDTFDGKVLWYLVTVKLDLEARGEIERITEVGGHKLRIKK
ncbi:MAG: hypothetical protein AAFN93_05895 [Bacteroidota bacterium]